MDCLLRSSFLHPDHQEKSQGVEISLAEQGFLMEVKLIRETEIEALSGNRNEDRLPRKSCLQ